MPKPRALVRRRGSIHGIRKITRTMELISTTKSKRAITLATEATAYVREVAALMARLLRSGQDVRHGLLEDRPNPQRATLLVLTGNRGLCAGYNMNVLRLAYARLIELHRQIPSVGVEVSGKRGIAAFSFRRLEIDEQFTHFEDKPRSKEVNLLADRYLEAFAAGELDRLDVAYTRFEGLGRQQAVVETFLPWDPGEAAGAPPDGPQGRSRRPEPLDRECFPSAQAVLEEIVPAGFRARLWKCFLDAGLSEQVARMVAMRTATEAADAMVENLTVAYHRARQTQITTELLEIIAGAGTLGG